jgi:prepilin-type processing-associated H-X9-DG protein
LTTECRSNLREIGLALRIYADDSDHYPMATGRSFIGHSEANGLIVLDDWKEALIPYLGLSIDKSVVTAVGDADTAVSFLKRSSTLRKLRCPQVIRKEDGARGNGQYAYNASGTARFDRPANLGLGGCWQGRFRATSESRIIAPADLLAVGDITPGESRDLVIFSVKPADADGLGIRFTFDASGHFDVCSTNPAFWPGTSHAGGANMLFVDGHVESGRQTNWLSLAARHRWNNDHEPHPETWARE